MPTEGREDGDVLNARFDYEIGSCCSTSARPANSRGQIQLKYPLGRLLFPQETVDPLLSIEKRFPDTYVYEIFNDCKLLNERKETK